MPAGHSRSAAGIAVYRPLKSDAPIKVSLGTKSLYLHFVTKKMLKDIEELKSEGVGIATVQEWDETGDNIVYNVYLVNLHKTPIEGVLVMSHGFGTIDGEERKSSVLRHFLDTVEGESYARIEPIQHELFVLTNQYKLTYFDDGKMYERTFEFESNTIHPDNFKQVPILKKPGVLLI
jgi:hypothetical protein